MECSRPFLVALVLICLISISHTSTGRPVVVNPIFTSINSTYFRVTWDVHPMNVSPINYNVTIRTTEHPSSMELLTIQAANNSNQWIEINNLSPYTLYEVTITGRDRFSELIDPITLVQRTAAALPSESPVNISLEAFSSNQIRVTWGIDLQNVNGRLIAFNIYYSATDVVNSNLSVYNVSLGDIGPYEIQLTALSANTYYVVNVSVVNNIGEGMKYAAGGAKTFPLVPVNNLQPMTTYISSTSTTVVMQVPAQSLFPTADIAVIYVIVEENTPPVLTTYNKIQIYNSVSSSRNGSVSLDGVPVNSIRIQAMLGQNYFNTQTNYFEFKVGDGVVTTYNGLTVTNIPLDPLTAYHISYFILFNDENGETSASLSLINNLFTKTIQADSPTSTCLSCFLPSVIIFTSIILLFIAALAVVFSYYFYCTRCKKVSLPPVVVKKMSLRKQKVKAERSLVFANPNAENPPVIDIEYQK